MFTFKEENTNKMILKIRSFQKLLKRLIKKILKSKFKNIIA